jgi:hypothetical protein
MTVWFYALVTIATVFAASLIIRAVLADKRSMREYEPPAEPDPEWQPEEELRLAA